ncbi:hypothetical protein EMIT0196P_50385 [Pseudomonas chlororaphis]
MFFEASSSVDNSAVALEQKIKVESAAEKNICIYDI